MATTSLLGIVRKNICDNKVTMGFQTNRLSSGMGSVGCNYCTYRNLSARLVAVIGKPFSESTLPLILSRGCQFAKTSGRQWKRTDKKGGEVENVDRKDLGSGVCLFFGYLPVFCFATEDTRKVELQNMQNCTKKNKDELILKRTLGVRGMMETGENLIKFGNKTINWDR